MWGSIGAVGARAVPLVPVPGNEELHVDSAESSTAAEFTVTNDIKGCLCCTQLWGRRQGRPSGVRDAYVQGEKFSSLAAAGGADGGISPEVLERLCGRAPWSTSLAACLTLSALPPAQARPNRMGP